MRSSRRRAKCWACRQGPFRMSRVTLKQVLGPRQEAGRLVDELAGVIGTPVSIEDVEGRLLYGTGGGEAESRHPIALEGASVGWVSGEPRARAVATLLAH